jgi:hypothetical protein
MRCADGSSRLPKHSSVLPSPYHASRVPTLVERSCPREARALSLAEKLEAGVPFSAADLEPEDVDPINAALHALLHAMPPRQVAELTVRLAEETDRRVTTLDPQRLWPEEEAGAAQERAAAAEVKTDQL